MDWKEAAKWMAVLVASGAVSAVIELVIENHFRGIARAEATQEVDRVVAAAVQRMQAQQAQTATARKPLNFSPPIKESGSASVFG